MVVDTGDRVWNAIANKPLDQIDLSAERRELLREAVFIKPLPNVQRVIFIATPHRGSYLTEYPVTELLGRFLTLPVRIVQTGVELARNAGDFKVNPRSLGSGSLFGMTPNNPVLQTMSTTPIALASTRIRSLLLPATGPSRAATTASSSIRARISTVSIPNTSSARATPRSRTRTRSRRYAGSSCFTRRMLAGGCPAASRLPQSRTGIEALTPLPKLREKVRRSEDRDTGNRVVMTVGACPAAMLRAIRQEWRSA